MNKTLKKIVLWLLAVCMMSFLAGCNEKETQGEEMNPTMTQPAQTEGMIVERPTIVTEPQSATQPQEATQPQQETVPATQPEETPTKPNTQGDAPGYSLSMSYQQYMNLSSAQQQAFFDTHFADDPLGFAEWFRKTKEAYEDETPEIIATGPVDIGDYINP